jgi:hypothetical protein
MRREAILKVQNGLDGKMLDQRLEAEVGPWTCRKAPHDWLSDAAGVWRRRCATDVTKGISFIFPAKGPERNNEW